MRWRTGIGGLSIAAVVATFGAIGCVGEREFPKPLQMCANLVTACGTSVLLEYKNDDLRELFGYCYAVGTAGQEDETHEAQCFASYDYCIYACEFYGDVQTLDGGADADADVVAPVLDAEAELPDAQTARDE